MSKKSDAAKGISDDTPKTCFIITPIGPNESDIRRAADGVIAAVIKPVMEKLDYQVVVPHEITTSGSITLQVITQILDADMVIANLTGLNPNVMYELAIRHAKRKPVVAIVENETRLPFDLAEERTVFYANDMLGVTDLVSKLEKAVMAAQDDDAPDNPIYRTVERSIMKEVAKDDFQTLVVERLSYIEDRISEVAVNKPRAQSRLGIEHMGHEYRQTAVIVDIEGEDFSESLKGQLDSALVLILEGNATVRTTGESKIAYSFITTKLFLEDARLTINRVMMENGITQFLMRWGSVYL